MNSIGIILVLAGIVGIGMAKQECTNQIFKGSKECNAPDGTTLYTYDSKMIAGQCLRCTCYPIKEGARMYCCDHGYNPDVKTTDPLCSVDRDADGCNPVIICSKR